MKDTARDIMERKFLTLQPDMTIFEAVQVLQQASALTGRQVFGLMVSPAVGGHALHV